ncbi:FxLYD domain-containing protein [Halalkalicoccus tibetensis]|uniref:FxLYD domain-containing protein n=1 Tax=Halalkalicoccus tibetensis TaxID=175632 RepID=A0ABD5V3W7_9EURY
MDRDEGIGRRRLLATLGSGAAIGVAGCLGSGSSSEPAYESGDVPGEIDGEERTAEETTAAESMAEQTPQADLAPLDALSLVEHGFVFEEGYTGSTVQGTAENDGDERLDSAEARVRVYNDEGEQLGLYLDSVSDLEGGSEWAFEVVLLESPEDIADYDIAAVGLPD